MEQRLYKQMSELEDTHWWFIARRRIVAAIVKKYAPELKESSEVLDAGCGTGGNLNYFKNLYPNIKGMEMNLQACELAVKKTGVQVEYGKFPDEIPFKDTEFDLVLMLDVLEHLDDDILALNNIRKIIKNKKYLVATVPAFNFLWSGHDEIHHHKRRYTLEELRKKAEKCGFVPIYSSYFNFLLFPLILIYRILKIDNSDDLQAVQPALNIFLSRVMSFEAKLMKYCRLPFGCSLLMVLKNNVI